MRCDLRQGDCLAVLRTLPAESAQTCITSPPYFGLRDYGIDGQIGLEDTPDAYVARLVEVFEEVRRVLTESGTLWLNLGDSYACARGGTQGHGGQCANRSAAAHGVRERKQDRFPPGLKPKDLIGIPWRVAFALQAAGWWLRSDIIWHKPAPMPESVRDRPTKAHEYLFLLAKSDRYLYDAEACAEPAIHAGRIVKATGDGAKNASGSSEESDRRTAAGFTAHDTLVKATRNRRSVWTVNPRPFKGAHFATFPPDLIEPCVLAGSRPGDLVLDPFNGAGTTGVVALKHDRKYLGIDLNPEYLAISRARIRDEVGGLFLRGAA